MGFPPGMVLNTIAFGIPLTATGKDVVTKVTVKPTSRVIWAATGQPLPEFSDSFTAEAGQLGQFQVPAVDQPGFIDSAGNAVTDFAYQITASWEYANERPINWSKNLKPLQAQSGIIDLDLVPDGPVSIPVTAPTAAVLGFGGRTGFVTLQESDLPGRLSDASLSATYVRGKAGKKYALVSGVMRNPGAAWEPIIDADHQGDSNVDSITTTGGAAVINFASLGVTKVVSFTATPDEALSNNGVRVGASVTRTAASIFFTQDMDVADYIFYDGAAWVSSTGSYTMSFTAGVLTITHTKKMLGTLTSSDIVLSPRGGVLRPVVSTASSATSATGAKIEFFTNAGVLQTTPTTDMKVFVSQAAHGYVNAASINESNFAFSNVWFMGVFEVA